MSESKWREAKNVIVILSKLLIEFNDYFTMLLFNVFIVSAIYYIFPSRILLKVGLGRKAFDAFTGSTL